jgi:DNA-binding NtrC family response regulator/tetratricopeptide (TPR) repeat protein
VQSAIVRAHGALERGRGAEAVQALAPLLRNSLPREDELAVRTALAEAWLLQDDLVQASSALGRPPDGLREPLSDAQLSTIWRLHGRITFARGEQSRAIALHTRALKYAELAHDSRAIGLCHYELALCYKQVGDTGIFRDHLMEAAAALHAAGDRRHLALAHSLSAILLAQSGRTEEALASLRHAERLATAIQANDALAAIVHNQANVALMRHRHDEALALAQRSVEIHQTLGSGQGLAIALATVGQIFVQLGELDRAEETLTRALEVPTQVKVHETTGAVFDTLAQIHLMRGTYDRSANYLRLASEAYGAYGSQTMRWYEWSVKVLGVKLAIRRGAFDEALQMADALVDTPGIPPADAIQADLAGCEALLASGRVDEAESRLKGCEARLDPRKAPGNWGEYLRIRAIVHEQRQRYSPASSDYAQSANVFDLLGERYQAALSELALGRLATRTGQRGTAQRYLDLASTVFAKLGAQRDLDEVTAARDQLRTASVVPAVALPADADAATVRRLVEAAILPELLARETATALIESTDAEAIVVFVKTDGGETRMLASAGCDSDAARALARAAIDGVHAFNGGALLVEPLGKDADGARMCAIVTTRPSDVVRHRFRMFVTVARQGFQLCGMRERPMLAADGAPERSLEPLLPGFICASGAMNRVADQIQRFAGHNLTVLITGESGTGKDLVARAIHLGSPRKAARFFPYNCTTTTRDLADSQLFGHRRGSFTGALNDQPGIIRSAAPGTLFLDEIGDLPIDVQPKLLRFLEQGEVLPVGETRPQAIDVRVLAATNADLEQRVADGKFREDLYYRLSVIRIHVPSLRERREEVPHLSTFFVRDACDRLGKQDIHLSTTTLDLFSRYWWPGNVRQLRNEIQRAVAMIPSGGTIEPEHLSADLTVPVGPAGPAGATGSLGQARSGFSGASRIEPGNLQNAIDVVERQMISATLERAGGNISETARVLGLTRRGLRLKMQRLGLETVPVS